MLYLVFALLRFVKVSQGLSKFWLTNNINYCLSLTLCPSNLRLNISIGHQNMRNTEV